MIPCSKDRSGLRKQVHDVENGNNAPSGEKKFICRLTWGNFISWHSIMRGFPISRDQVAGRDAGEKLHTPAF